MKSRLRIVLLFFVGSTAIFIFGAVAVAILVMRGTVCRELTYDGGDICLGNADKSLWFEWQAAFWGAVAAWISSSLIIPVLVAYKSRRPGWAIVAFLLVVTGSIVGDLAARFWIRREYPGMDWPQHGSDSIALLSVFVALFVTLIGSAVAVELSNEQAENLVRGSGQSR